jgi:hypothetical protein
MMTKQEKDYCEIKLPSGHVVLVDRENYERTRLLRLNLEIKKGRVFAYFYRSVGLNKKAQVYLHRFLFGVNIGRVLFLNGNGLDCRRSNLTFKPKMHRGKQAVRNIVCAYCGNKKRKVVYVDSEYAFDSVGCYFNFRENSPHFALHTFNAGITSRERNTFYTPSMIRRFTEWAGLTCAFPCCNEPLSSRRRNKFNLCRKHAMTFNGSVQSNKRRAKQQMVKLGFDIGERNVSN